MRKLSDDLSKCIVLGNVRIDSDMLRRTLKKAYYYMEYDKKTGTIALKCASLGGNGIILEATNVPYETVKRFAEEIGLSAESGEPTSWVKFNPSAFLDHDGSRDAEELHFELLRLGIPHSVHKNANELALGTGSGTYRKPLYTKDEMLKKIRALAKTFEKELSTTP